MGLGGVRWVVVYWQLSDQKLLGDLSTLECMTGSGNISLGMHDRLWQCFSNGTG